MSIDPENPCSPYSNEGTRHSFSQTTQDKMRRFWAKKLLKKVSHFLVHFPPQNRRQRKHTIMAVVAGDKGDFKGKQFAGTEVADKVVEQCKL